MCHYHHVYAVAGKPPKIDECPQASAEVSSDSGGDDDDEVVAIIVPILVIVFIALVVCGVILLFLAYRAWSQSR